MCLIFIVENVFTATIYDRRIKKLTYFTFLFAAVASLVFIYVYRSVYGLDFGPAGDDAKYFDRVCELAYGQIPDKYTLFSIVLSFYYRLLNIFINKPVLLDLLPFNWFFAALTVCLAHVLAVKISGKYFSIWLTFCATALNFRFLDIMVHLYRDVLLMFVVLLSLVLAINKKYLLSFSLVAIALMIRTASGFMLAGGLLVVYVFQSFSSNSKKIAMSLVVLTLLIPSVYMLQAKIIEYSTESILTHHDTQKESMDFYKMSLHRKDTLFSGDQQQGKLYDILYNSPFFYFLRPFLTLFLPVSFDKPYQYQNVHVSGRLFSFYYMPNLGAIANWITIPLWIVIGPLLVLGVLNGLQGTDSQKSLIIIFLFWLLIISIFSFQSRHSCAFIILIPAIAAIGKGSHSQFKQLLTCFFILLILGFNVFRYCIKLL
jgi:hypothetical protein